MKNIKRFSVVFLFFSIAAGLVAQKYSVEAGYVQQQRYGKQFKTNYFDGFKAGANIQFDLKHNFSLLTGGLYQFLYSENTQYFTASDTVNVNYKTMSHSIEIPLQVQFSLPVSKNFKFFAYAGPNISIGLFQPQKVTASIPAPMKDGLDNLIPENMKDFIRLESDSYANNDLYKKNIIQRINLQMSIGGGAQYKNYRLKSGYDFGINSINKIDSNNVLRQRGWYVSLVYQF
ncbi:MAG: hypothetical protein KA206_05260 [Paludibacter sp.]|nr:hypothetical protein [Paludibacter sp.]